MNEATRAKLRRSAELSQLKSAALSDMLTAAGYGLSGMHRKQDKVSALLHLEGHTVADEIVGELGLVKLEAV